MALITSRRGFLGGLLVAVAAPAIVRFDSIMPVRSIDRILPVFGFESFDRLVPEGQAYQWVTRAPYDCNMQNWMEMLRRGWRPVPASRHKNSFKISGDEITIGGPISECVLVERPIRQVRKSVDNDIVSANAMIGDWMDHTRKQGFVVAVEYGRETVDDLRLVPTAEERSDLWRGLKPL